VVYFGGCYWLTVEQKQGASGYWVDAYYSESLGGPYHEVGNNPILPDRQAVHEHRIDPNGNLRGYVNQNRSGAWYQQSYEVDVSDARYGYGGRLVGASRGSVPELGATVSYNGSGDYTAVHVPHLPQYTIILVSKVTDANSGGEQTDAKLLHRNGIQMRYDGSGGYQFYHYNSSGFSNVANASATSDTWAMWSMRYDGDTVTAEKNANQVGSSDNISNNNAQRTGDFALGGAAPASKTEFLDGEQAFFIPYPKALSDTQLQTVYDKLLG